MPSRVKQYRIHDNGSTPFLVKDYSRFIEVYTTDEPTKQVFDSEYTRIFVGADPLKISHDGWNRRDRGNSVLIQRPSGDMVFIGWKIQSFKLKPGDEPVLYESYVGNNDVPYPYLVGKTHTYLLIEGRVIPNEVLHLKKDAYSQYYGFEAGASPTPVKGHAKRLPMKIIHDRIF